MIKLKTRHIFDSEKNVDRLLEAGKIDANDILLLTTGANKGKIAWIDKDGNKVDVLSHEALNIEVGEVRTAQNLEPPSVSIRGDSPNYIMDFVFPQGGLPVIVDGELSATSENPVQNKVITEALGKLSKPAENGVLGIVCGTDAVDGVSVNQDGTMTVNNISFSKIVQNPEDKLILVCGDSN